MAEIRVYSLVPNINKQNAPNIGELSPEFLESMGLTAEVHHWLPKKIGVRVTDEIGSPIPNYPVGFRSATPSSGDALELGLWEYYSDDSKSQITDAYDTTTNSDGIAELPNWRLGIYPGIYPLRISVPSAVYYLLDETGNYTRETPGFPYLAVYAYAKPGALYRVTGNGVNPDYLKSIQENIPPTELDNPSRLIRPSSRTHPVGITKVGQRSYTQFDQNPQNYGVYTYSLPGEETITLSTTIPAYEPEEKYEFSGWYDRSGNLVSTERVYQFTMPNEFFVYLYAKWNEVVFLSPTEPETPLPPVTPEPNTSVPETPLISSPVPGVGPAPVASSGGLAEDMNKEFPSIAAFAAALATGVTAEINKALDPVKEQLRAVELIANAALSSAAVANSVAEAAAATAEAASAAAAAAARAAAKSSPPSPSRTPGVTPGVTPSVTPSATPVPKDILIGISVDPLAAIATVGTITGAGLYRTGDLVTLSVLSPPVDYKFDGWYRQDGQRVSTSEFYSFTAQKSENFVLKFTQ